MLPHMANRGLWKFVPSLYNSVSKLDVLGFIQRTTSVAVTKNGEIVFRPLLVNDVLMISEMYEPEVSKVFTPEEGSIVLDVGAYIGYWSLHASKAVGSKGRVIAVEPNPESFSILSMNVKRNSLNNITAVNSAAGATDDDVTFYISSHDPTASTILSTMAESYYRSRRIKVHMITLDSLTQRLGIEKVDWIKIDIEGAELEALRGCKETIKRSANLKIILETDNEKVIHYLRELGLSVAPLNLANYYLAQQLTKEK
jgi:FkbM family methyltransferase